LTRNKVVHRQSRNYINRQKLCFHAQKQHNVWCGAKPNSEFSTGPSQIRIRQRLQSMETGAVAMNNNSSNVIHHQNETRATSTITIKGILSLIMENIDVNLDGGNKRVISLGMGDPTLTTLFHTPKVVEEAVADSLHSHKFHGYAPTAGLPQARM